MIIRDILNMKGSKVFSVGPNDKAADAVKLMVAHDIGSLVVLDGGKMTGMLTFREVLRGLDSQSGNLADLRVNSVMVTKPICCSPDDSIDHLREVMIQNHVRYLPIRDGEQLLGVVSFHDVAKAVIKATSFENRLLKRYIKDWPAEDEPVK